MLVSLVGMRFPSLRGGTPTWATKPQRLMGPLVRKHPLVQCADTRSADTNSYGDANSNTDANDDADGDTNENTDRYADGDTNVNTNQDTYGGEYVNTDTNGYSDHTDS